MKILIIGGGNMGLTFAKSFLSSHIVSLENMLILEKSPNKAEKLREMEVGTIYDHPGDYMKKADLIILAVKPQDSEILFTKIRKYIDPQQVILSIMAGVKIESIQQLLNAPKVIRAMPNLPAQVGTGMTVFSSSNEVTRIEMVMVQNLLNSTGKTIYVESQKLIDAATAVSGSGPAYVFYFMQSMIDAAKSLGFNQSDSELLTFQTFRGAVDLFNKHEFTCDEWIQKVSSKGGTTEAAFERLSSYSLNDKVKDAIVDAFERAVELGS